LILQTHRYNPLIIREFSVNHLGNKVHNRIEGRNEPGWKLSVMCQRFVTIHQAVDSIPEQSFAEGSSLDATKININPDTCICQAVAISGNRTQFLALNQQYQTVEIITLTS
jgi:hypothetical protein